MSLIYDEARDAFIPPEPSDAIGFDEDTLTWIVPEPELPAEDEEFSDEEFSEPGHVLSSVLLEMREDVRY